MRRYFSSNLRQTPLKTNVCIVGSGPVGMVLSSMLNKFKIPNIILDKHQGVQDHPKAHYIGFRTCEILKDLGIEKPLEKKLEQIQQWNNFNYATHVIGGKLYGRVNHFDFQNTRRNDIDYKKVLEGFKEKFTYAYPNHFSQNKLNTILLELLDKQKQDILFQHDYLNHQIIKDGQEGCVKIKIEDRQSKGLVDIECDFLVGADGVKSKVRQNLGIEMFGANNIQNFVNLHFRSKEIGELMKKQDRTSMLYFLYNQDLVSVLVCHDIDEGEFVLQVPYFPPIESIDDYKDQYKCLEIIRKSMFSDELRSRSDIQSIKIDLRNINAWKMEGVVADSYINLEKDKTQLPRVYLVGDAAHAFPPSGGFGMNTGIGDSFNLAHKFAYFYQNKNILDNNQQRELLKSYDTERKYIGEVTRDLAMINYEKSIIIAGKLDLDKKQAEYFNSVVKNYIPDFLPIDKKKLFKFGMDLGLMKAQMTMKLTNSEEVVSKYLASDKKHSIKLMFPNLDFAYAYPADDYEAFAHAHFMKDHFDNDEQAHFLGLGTLVPHIRIQDQKDCFSLRQLMTQLNFSHEKSLNFILILQNRKSFNELNDKLSKNVKDLKPNNTLILRNQNLVSLFNEFESVKLDLNAVDFSKVRNMYKDDDILVYRGDCHLVFKC
ncbi:polyketide hydroxylase-like [Stylonychia lemnae]|uniref:Polyketide hydroxylase-like n=1 Tax=Stylonychia lemnae TaxID=5949 RepID=A0A078AZ44_STYLE|nr:polyketide hydroxylase-like [Stylonychia lemnae]|eukprot:CDW87725.1 polyketide hydroxylase-like [Stylonychia lemnae]